MAENERKQTTSDAANDTSGPRTRTTESLSEIGDQGRIQVYLSRQLGELLEQCLKDLQGPLAPEPEDPSNRKRGMQRGISRLCQSAVLMWIRLFYDPVPGQSPPQLAPSDTGHVLRKHAARRSRENLSLDRLIQMGAELIALLLERRVDEHRKDSPFLFDRIQDLCKETKHDFGDEVARLVRAGLALDRAATARSTAALREILREAGADASPRK